MPRLVSRSGSAVNTARFASAPPLSIVSAASAHAREQPDGADQEWIDRLSDPIGQQTARRRCAVESSQRRTMKMRSVRVRVVAPRGIEQSAERAVSVAPMSVAPTASDNQSRSQSRVESRCVGFGGDGWCRSPGHTQCTLHSAFSTHAEILACTQH